MSQQGGQSRATCCTQHSCDMLHSDVAIVRPEIANAGPIMLGYVVLKCCDRLLALADVDSLVLVGQKNWGVFCSRAAFLLSAGPKSLLSNSFFICSLEIGNVFRLPEVICKCSKTLFASVIESVATNNGKRFVELRRVKETINDGS